MARRKIQFVWDQGLPDGRCLFANSIRRSDRAYWNTDTKAFEVYDADNVLDYGILLEAVITSPDHPDGYVLFQADYPEEIGFIETEEAICLGLGATPGLVGPPVPVVDQSQPLGTQPELLLAAPAFAQSFVPELPTVRAVKFFGYGRPEGDVVVNVAVRSNLNGQDLAIGSALVTGGGVEDYEMEVVFAEPLAVVPGEKYYFVIENWQNNWNYWSMFLRSDENIPGTDNQLYQYDGGNSWSVRAGWSFKFEESAATGTDSLLAVIQSQGYLVRTPGPVVFPALLDGPAFFVNVNEMGEFWNTATEEFEAWDIDNFQDYLVAMTEVAGMLWAEFPSAIPEDADTIQIFFIFEGIETGPVFLGWARTQAILVPLVEETGALPSVLSFALQPAGETPGVYAEQMLAVTCYAEQNDVGVRMVVQFVDAAGEPIDISGASEKTILLKLPSGDVVEKEASFLTDGQDGKICFDTEPSVDLTGTLTEDAEEVTGLASTAELAEGMAVSGDGIPEGTTVTSVDSGTAVTLSSKATEAGAKALTFGAYDLAEAGEYSIQGRVTEGAVTQGTEAGGFVVNAI